MREIKVLISNKAYMLLMLTFTCLYGIYTSLGAVVSSVTEPYGYVATDNAVFGAVFILFGVIGSFIFSILLDKYQRFKLIINVITFLGCIFTAFAFVTLPSRNVALFSFNLALIGFTVIPIIPISYAFSVELTFPVPESLSNGMIILPSQIYGTLLGVTASKLSEQSPHYAIALFFISALVGAVASLFIKEELRRLRPNKVGSACHNDRVTLIDSKKFDKTMSDCDSI